MSIATPCSDSSGNPKTAGGDPFAVRILNTSCTPDVCTAYVRDNGDGTYTLRYKFTQAGTYRLNVTLGDQHVGSRTNVSSPLKLSILSATAGRVIDLSKTSVSGDGLLGAVSGIAASFVVTTYDASAIRLFQGGAIFKLQMTPSASNRVQKVPTSSVTDNKDGTYTVSYSTVGAGTYAMSLFGGSTGSIPIPALSGAAVTVLPGPTVAAKTTVAPFTPKAIIAGQIVQALIAPGDAYGNLVAYGGNYPATNDNFIVQAIPGKNAVGYPTNYSVTTVYNQAYLATANLTGVGNYLLTVLLGGQLVATGAFTVAVAVGQSVNPFIVGAGINGPWPAGTAQEVDVYPFDYVNNDIDAYSGCTCVGYFTSAIAPTVVSPCAITDGSTNGWDGSDIPMGFLYMLPHISVAASYTLTVNITQTAYPGYVNSKTVDTPIVVSPGDPSPTFTKAFGPGVSPTGGQAGQNTSFTIAVKDGFNNTVPNPTGVTYQVTNVATGALIYGSMVNNNDGTLTVTYMPLTAGAHKVTVSVVSKAIGNPFSVAITPALTSAAKTTALLSGSAAPLTSGTQYAITAGQTAKLVVTAYDVYGKKQLAARSDNFTVTFTPPVAADGGSTGAKYSQAVNNNDGKNFRNPFLSLPIQFCLYFDRKMLCERTLPNSGEALQPCEYLLSRASRLLFEVLLVNFSAGSTRLKHFLQAHQSCKFQPLGRFKLALAPLGITKTPRFRQDAMSGSSPRIRPAFQTTCFDEVFSEEFCFEERPEF